MDSSKPSKRLLQVTKIASAAALTAQNYFDNRTDLSIGHKSPGQAVTEADREVETQIRSAMQIDFPGEAVVGEEFGGQSAQSFWTIDPIDGTANFLNGLPFWGVAIGHITQGVPDVGVVILPQLNLTATTEHNRLFLNGSQFTRPDTPIPSVSLGQADTETLTESLELHKRYRTAGFSVYHWRCSSLSLAWNALGQISGHLHQRTTLWDAVPGAALCRAAGLEVRLGNTPDGVLWIKSGDAAVHKLIGSTWESDHEVAQ